MKKCEGSVCFQEASRARKHTGLGPVGSSPQEFAAFIADDRKRWVELISTAKIKAE